MFKHNDIHMRLHRCVISLSLLFLSILPLSAIADDTELLFASSNQEYNILLLLDNSMSMKKNNRLEQLKEAVKIILQNEYGGNVSFGYTTFGGRSPGILWPVANLDEKASTIDATFPTNTTVRTALIDTIGEMGLDKKLGTIMGDAMLEGIKYFRGMNTSKTNQHESTHDNSRYLTPITKSNQINAIILLSDGLPTGKKTKGAEKFLADAMGVARYKCKEKRCITDMAKFLANNKQIPSVANSTVVTHTIGFDMDEKDKSAKFMKAVADSGNGDAYFADNTQSLVDAFDGILRSVLQGSRSFSGVTTSIQQDSLKTDGSGFFNLFEPSLNSNWQGNIKGFNIKDGKLYGTNNLIATEYLDGALRIKSSARSYWSITNDGSKVSEGGVLEVLRRQNSRTLYVLTSPQSTPNINLTTAGNGYKLSYSENSFFHSQTGAKALGLPASASQNDVKELLESIQAPSFGDSLHAKPVVAHYGESKKVLFAATNHGFIHAFNVTRGGSDTRSDKEIFAFMPFEHLSKQYNIQHNAPSDNHIYGNDGALKLYHKDVNLDGKINNGEKCYLFFGMRRGGSAYYALDVSTPETPKIAWSIRAGDNGFLKLGQSWSTPEIIKIENGGSERVLLVFGGGYDTQHDVAETARGSGDNTGMGIYFIDAETGELLNSIGNDSSFLSRVAEMKYAIPSDIRAIDSDGNGFTDRLYVGDLGGQVWRVDIQEGINITNPNSVSAFRLATLSGATLQSNRRFYHPPAVAFTFHNGQQKIAVAIGSGYHAHPLNNSTQERMHVIFDKDANVGKPERSRAAITESQMVNVTDNLVQSINRNQREVASTLLANKSGWYINYDTTEKSMSSPFIFNNRLIFTTLITHFNGTGNCEGCFSKTRNRYYTISLVDGSAIQNFAGPDGEPPESTNHLRSVLLTDEVNLIASTPEVIVYEKPANPADPDGVSVGCVALMIGLNKTQEDCYQLHSLFWKENN